jgi:hypothetical protein
VQILRREIPFGIMGHDEKPQACHPAHSFHTLDVPRL